MVVKIEIVECPEIARTGVAFLNACNAQSERKAMENHADANECVMIMHTTFLWAIGQLIMQYNKSVLHAIKKSDKDVQGGEKHA